jgi:hypothetical protein
LKQRPSKPSPCGRSCPAWARRVVGLTIEYSFVIAAMLAVMVARYADPADQKRYAETAILGVGPTVFGVLLFIKLLGLPIPIWPRWS